MASNDTIAVPEDGFAQAVSDCCIDNHGDESAVTLVKVHIDSKAGDELIKLSKERTKYNWTAVHYFSFYGYARALVHLLTRLADVAGAAKVQDILQLTLNSRTAHPGCTPLHIANTPEVASVILAAASDAATLQRFPNDAGHTPAQHSKSICVYAAHRILTWGEPQKEVLFPWQGQVTPIQDYLKLGITTLGFVAILEAFGFWEEDQVSHKHVQKRVERGLDWVNHISPGEICGHDVQKALEIGVNDPSYSLQRASLCEILKAQSHPAVGSIDVFNSHAPAEPIKDTVTAMMQSDVEAGKTQYFFLDFPCLRQGEDDFNLPKIEDTIVHAGRLVMTLMPLEKPQVLTHAFCLFEVGCALRHDLDIEAIYPAGCIGDFVEKLAHDYKTTSEQFSRVDLRAASICEGQESAKHKILTTIEDDLGIEVAEKQIRAKILSETLKQMSLSGETFIDVRRNAGICPGNRQRGDPAKMAARAAAAVTLFADFIPELAKEDVHRILRHQGRRQYGLLHWAAWSGCDADTVRKLLKLGEDDPDMITMKDMWQKTAAQTAAEHNPGSEAEKVLRMAQEEVQTIAKEAVARSAS